MDNSVLLLDKILDGNGPAQYNSKCDTKDTMRTLALIIPGAALIIAGGFYHSMVAMGFGALLIGLDAVTRQIVDALHELAAAFRGEIPESEVLADMQHLRIEQNKNN